MWFCPQIYFIHFSFKILDISYSHHFHIIVSATVSIFAWEHIFLNIVLKLLVFFSLYCVFLLSQNLLCLLVILKSLVSSCYSRIPCVFLLFQNPLCLLVIPKSLVSCYFKIPNQEVFTVHLFQSLYRNPPITNLYAY